MRLPKNSLELDATACEAYATVLLVQLVCCETDVAAFCSTVAASLDAAVSTEAVIIGLDEVEPSPFPTPATAESGAVKDLDGALSA
jgi:hypothetical protein